MNPPIGINPGMGLQEVTCGICCEAITEEPKAVVVHDGIDGEGKAWHACHELCLGRYFGAGSKTCCPSCRQEERTEEEKGCAYFRYEVNEQQQLCNLQPTSVQAIAQAWRDTCQEADQELLDAVQKERETAHTEVEGLLIRHQQNEITIEQKTIARAVRLASGAGSLEAVQLLLKLKTIDCFDRGDALLTAARMGHREIIEVLLEDGAIDEDTEEHPMRTFVANTAIKSGKLEIASRLFRDIERPVPPPPTLMVPPHALG
jgi:hypothetical protein